MHSGPFVMLSCDALIRSSRFLKQRATRPILRSAFGRRYAQTRESGLSGPADNAFNRERAAVKQHAAATSGEPPRPFYDESGRLMHYRTVAQTLYIVQSPLCRLEGNRAF